MRIYQGTFDVMKPMPPFIFELRQANRAGRKSQTRRVIQYLIPEQYTQVQEYEPSKFRIVPSDEHGGQYTLPRCPYGFPGQIVYMREPLTCGLEDYAYYRDGNDQAFNIVTGEPIKWKWKKAVLSQLYMPKIAARSFFQYEFIRVERLQEIRFEAALAEGITISNSHWNWGGASRVIERYITLWNQINAERGYPWDLNPWVWVLGYKPFDMKEISVINSNIEVAK